jgi:competence protein ComGC
MNKKARSFVTVMMIVAVSALVLRFTVEQLIKRSITQNEAGALSSLKLISAALENYAKDNRGIFPVSLADLTKTSPLYLDRDYIKESPIKGYTYSCSKLDSSGYNCTAAPVKCKMNGRTVYNISTGGLFVSEGCKKEE